MGGRKESAPFVLAKASRTHIPQNRGAADSAAKIAGPELKKEAIEKPKTDGTVIAASPPNPCWIIRIKESDSCISDGKGSIFVFTKVWIGRQYITDKRIPGAFVQYVEWNDLVERAKSQFHSVIVFPENGSNACRKFPLKEVVYGNHKKIGLK